VKRQHVVRTKHNTGTKTPPVTIFRSELSINRKSTVFYIVILTRSELGKVSSSRKWKLFIAF
jgi:hypothetical protein